MRIVKAGKIKDDLHGTCKACGCVIECKQSEAGSWYDQRDGASGFHRPCPTCGRTIQLRDGPYPAK